METSCSMGVVELGRFIEALYGTVQDCSTWESVLALLCHHIGADSASIRFYRAGWSEVAFSATHGFEPECNLAYRDHFVHADPIPLTIEDMGMRPGAIALLEEGLPFRQLQRTEFYSDFLRPYDKRHIMGGYLYYEDGAKAIVGLQRGHHRRAFVSEDRHLLGLLAPHFQQVLRLHQMLTESRMLSDAVNQTLDALNIATFFLDNSARVRLTNARADMLLRCGSPMLLRHGRLHARPQEHDRLLQQLIETAVNTPEVTPREAGGAIQLRAADIGTAAITVIITPWRNCSAFDTPLVPGIVAAVFAGNCAPPCLRTQYLSGAYGLTRTEARLAAKLVETFSLAKAAEAIGVTKQTARDYLKAIFRKTDCHSQVELIGTILTSPTGLWRRPPSFVDSRARRQTMSF